MSNTQFVKRLKERGSNALIMTCADYNSMPERIVQTPVGKVRVPESNAKCSLSNTYTTSVQATVTPTASSFGTGYIEFRISPSILGDVQGTYLEFTVLETGG